MPAEPGRERGAHLLLQTALDPVSGELADHAADRAADDRRCQQRRREQPDDQPDAAADLQALASEVVAGFLDRDGAVGVNGDEHHALHVELLVLDELHERVELLLGQVGDQVRRDDDVELGVAHDSLFRRCPTPLIPRTVSACEACSWRACSSLSSRCGATSKTTFLTVPVNANGALSA